MFFTNGLKAKVMSTELIIEANVSKKTLFEALEIVKNFEKKYSAYDDESLLSQINKAAGIEPVTCTKEDMDIFQKALAFAKKSQGIFDPTIGSLTQGVYGFGTQKEKIPTSKELQITKKLVDYRKIDITDNTIYLQEKDMRLDLGGIGKGYIADQVVHFLQQRNATKVLVNVGGELVMFGKHYAIGIQHPFAQKNIAIVHSKKSNLSISTSGDYERYIGSREYHHILDHKSARQQHYYSSLTLLKDGIEATLLDAVATIAFNTPPEKLQQVATQYNVAIFAVTPTQEIYIKNCTDLNIQKITYYS
jgi:thiamine biosynthesis lipoprotein